MINFFLPYLFKIKNSPDTIYLSFDDGPTEEATPFVLEQLKQYNATATFFCLGQQAIKFPHLIESIKQNGHSIGNHSFSHPNGWTTNTDKYIKDVESCDNILHARMFRPPYGRISPRQYFHLRKKYSIVFWTHLAKDYDKNANPADEIKRICNSVQEGSILTFHDSEQAFPRMTKILPVVLKHFSTRGNQFTKLDSAFM